MLNRLRHGQEISSDKLNEIIDTLNDFLSVVEGYKESSEELTDIHNKIISELTSLKNSSSEKFETLPTLASLIQTFIEAKTSGIEWNYSTDMKETSSKTVFFIGPLTSFPTDVRDKRILFDTTNHTIWVDSITSKGVFARELWSTAPKNNEGSIITAITPEISIVLETIYDSNNNPANQQYCWRIKDSTGVHIYNGHDAAHPYIPVTGTQGIQGTAGPQGPRGPQGLRGPQGDRGPQGPSGINGSKSMISFCYATTENGLNAQPNYEENKNLKYLGYKTYYDTDDNATIEAIPWTFIRILADTYYPYIDGEYLKFSTNPPSNSSNSFNIKGPKGDTGATGPTPRLAFKSADGTSYINVSTTSTDANGVVTHYYNSNEFQGPKGDSISLRKFGDYIQWKPSSETDSAYKNLIALEDIKGDPGNFPRLNVLAETRLENKPADALVEEIDSGYYRITLGIPKGAKGDSVEHAYLDEKGYLHLKLTNKEEEVVSTTSLKGERGLPVAITSTPAESLPAGSKPIVQATITDLANNGYSLAFSIPKGDKGDIGLPGNDGREIELSVTDTSIRWRYINDATWKDLVTLSSLKGPQGLKGDKGDIGDTGKGISSISKTTSTGLVDTYTIKFTDGTETSYTVSNGAKGDTGEKGDKGDQGKSAYDLAKEYDPSIGNEASWLASLKGEKGDNGTSVNIKGVAEKGTITLETIGSSGTILIPGTSTAITGQEGDAYLIEGKLVVWISSGIFQYVGEIKGPKGDTGQTGQTGPQGPKGDTGDTITLRKANGYIQWKLKTETDDTYSNLISLTDLKGDNGEKGDDGETGPRGSQWFTGEGVPSSTTVNESYVKDDDYYLDSSTGNYYIRAKGVWTSKGSLKGTQGSDGTIGPRGASFQYNWDGVRLGVKHSDETSYNYVDLQGPQGPAGKDGAGINVKTSESECIALNDAYIDSDGKLQILTSLEPKTYTDAGTIKGPKGDKGDIGPRGISIQSIDKTATNDLVDTYTITYTDGTTKAFTVTNGSNGSQGPSGISITGVTLEGDFNPFSEAENKYKISFSNGEAFVFSVYNGAQGEWGDPGIQGPKGDPGEPGTNGKDGTQIHSGANNPSADLGADGDFYINTTTGYLYKKSGGSWGNSLLALKGSKGETGDSGDTGPSFLEGYTGQVNTTPTAGKITFIW